MNKESNDIIENFAKRIRSHFRWCQCGMVIPKKPKETKEVRQ